MNFNYSHRNIDGSVTVNHVGMTKATYQYIHDSVMREYGPLDFVERTLEEKDPEKREELYRKEIFEAYLEVLPSLDQWAYRGSEKEARKYFWISECKIYKEEFEEMESLVWSYCDESVLSFDEEKTEEARESAYINTIVEDYIREMALRADLKFVHGDDDLFESVLARHGIL